MCDIALLWRSVHILGLHFLLPAFGVQGVRSGISHASTAFCYSKVEKTNERRPHLKRFRSAVEVEPSLAAVLS